MTEHLYKGRKQLREPARGKLLREILTFRYPEMLLVNTFIMMPKFMDEDVQQGERGGLSPGESTDGTILKTIIRNAQLLENALMRVEIRSVHLGPKVIWPGVEKNRSRLFATVKHVIAVILATVPCEHNSLQPLGKPIPAGNDFNESLHVSLAHHMTETASRCLPIKNASIMAGRSVTVFAGRVRLLLLWRFVC